jgi:hypothetical protein
MTQPHLDPHSAVRNAVLAHARGALRAFGISHGFLASHVCGCGREGCENDDVSTMSLAFLLRAVAEEWTGAPDPGSEAVLRERLLAFSRVFRLHNCPCGDPECRAGRIEAGSARDVVRTIADVWHGRAGNRVHHAAEHVASVARDHAANLATLHALALRLDPDDHAQFEPAVAAARAAEGGAWLIEARALAAEAIATWLPNPGGLEEVRRVMDSALSVAFHGDWTTAAAAAFERAAADACAGILVRGIAHPTVTEVLLAPLSAVIAVDDLDAAADAYRLAAGMAP